jgi:hypothetical protein
LKRGNLPLGGKIRLARSLWMRWCEVRRSPFRNCCTHSGLNQLRTSNGSYFRFTNGCLEATLTQRLLLVRVLSCATFLFFSVHTFLVVNRIGKDESVSYFLTCIDKNKGLAIAAMQTHPRHSALHVQGFKCLKDLDHDTKIAISHAGFLLLILLFILFLFSNHLGF